jgi:hypothetical protein
MPTCSNNCTSGSKEYGSINKASSNKPPTAFWGESVTIGVDVVSSSWIIPSYLSLELWDLNSGQCIASAPSFLLGAGTTQRVNLTAMMPSSGNANFRLSLIGSLLSNCQDFWQFNIIGVDPTATRYDCTINGCKPVTGGPFTSNTCNNTCTTGTSGCLNCDGTCIPIVNYCMKKNDLLIVAGLFLAYTFIKSK